MLLLRSKTKSVKYLLPFQRFPFRLGQKNFHVVSNFAMQTVKTVPFVDLLLVTGLKPGVNESG
jgi:hypothetical protein